MSAPSETPAWAKCANGHDLLITEAGRVGCRKALIDARHRDGDGPWVPDCDTSVRTVFDILRELTDLESLFLEVTDWGPFDPGCHCPGCAGTQDKVAAYRTAIKLARKEARP